MLLQSSNRKAGMTTKIWLWWTSKVHYNIRLSSNLKSCFTNNNLCIQVSYRIFMIRDQTCMHKLLIWRWLELKELLHLCIIHMICTLTRNKFKDSRWFRLLSLRIKQFTFKTINRLFKITFNNNNSSNFWCPKLSRLSNYHRMEFSFTQLSMEMKTLKFFRSNLIPDSESWWQVEIYT